MVSGDILFGEVIEENEMHVKIQLRGAGTMTLERSTIISISKDQKARVDEYGQIYHGDPNRTRYVYGPSAFQLKKGEGYVSQKELFFSSAAYGVTDNVSILVGSAIPLLFASDGFNLITAIKAGGPVYGDKLHLATGFESFFLGGGDVALGFVFGSATYGDPETHGTLSLGYPFALSANDNELGPAIATLSFNKRLTKSFALLTENWFLSISNDNDNKELMYFSSLCGRFIGQQFAFDLGLIFFKGSSVPIPWLDVTYNWF
ncbi:MAG: hypothetical protein CMH60_05400 [Myxococcales bacterium]|nr:hypothetical protein [Myxococcales bacterium]